MSYTAVTVGNFDGVHLGHIHLINELKKIAEKYNVKPLAITFEPHPVEVLSKRNRFFCKLSTLEEKKEIIEKQLGIEVVSLPFTKEFAQLSPWQFLEEYLLKKFNVKVILVGYDWKFGKNAAGTFLTVADFCAYKGCKALRLDPYKIGDKVVSSSLIRNLLKEARLKEASLYLGHPYWIRRKIEKGKGLGRKIGFPTLNLGNVDRLCLPNGVYVVCCDGHPAIANLGYAPTLKGFKRTLEVHILRDSFYVSDKPRVVFKQFLRPEKAFKTVKDLVEQIKTDIQNAKKIFLTD